MSAAFVRWFFALEVVPLLRAFGREANGCLDEVIDGRVGFRQVAQLEVVASFSPLTIAGFGCFEHRALVLPSRDVYLRHVGNGSTEQESASRYQRRSPIRHAVTVGAARNG